MLTRTQLTHMTNKTRQDFGFRTRSVSNTSTLSKRGKTQAQKDAASARNKANGLMRADLHRAKSQEDTITGRAAVQAQIDGIGAGGQA